MSLAGPVVASWSLTQEVAGSSPFKYPVSHMCLAGAVVASWSLTQEVAGSNPFTVMLSISANSLKAFREDSIGSDSLNCPTPMKNYNIKPNCVLLENN